MINLYIYDTGSGRVLGVGTYDERGDGAAARAIAVGSIVPALEYAPAGVKTARPTFNLATLLLDKPNIVANAVDSATVSGVPNGTTAKIYKDQEIFPRSVAVITDGSVVLRAEVAGVYRIVLENFPTQDTTFTVTAA